MAEPTQYSFTLQELAELLVRKQGITEGRWAVGFDLSIGVGIMGPNEVDARPGAMIQISGVNISKVPPDSPANANEAVFIVDAAALPSA
ncbi:MAG: hypothetical protein E5X23_06535 [Mesorhizobium sp.]|uniref:hypothetical protein n=1 Tax=unclassified Mesorhizobium TaxID=325217 RepID=UPI000FCC752B|nr:MULTISPECIES: hypothetical protein [unclassified Mesorhizobium]RUV39974.1 hypothetical protein EOD29_30330 [Mesorhizobium sp. M1A.T.Ca.IN.004.03.1.1]RWH50341.1 MAG: hypothetical protein EOQ81_25440 [Mesorhizobium sp.]RWK28562.1 MAG: hypothetical protein EOR40_28440 [Mesorhizobium sp.]RWK84296.1 MAG: hypothetical protein EOR52_29205 [Mesorhizobium sp.]TIP15308.1 MAG: hypothetical protein E5X66_30590 [Mesorhizobium sp.]